MLKAREEEEEERARRKAKLERHERKQYEKRGKGKRGRMHVSHTWSYGFMGYLGMVIGVRCEKTWPLVR